jgi:hypothetical protein
MLVISGVVPQIPPDPFGGRYLWDPEKRQVRSSANPFRFSPREARRAPGFHYQYKPNPTPPASEGTFR